VNKQFKLLTAVLAVGSLLLLAGCAKYKAMPLYQPKVLADKKGLTLEHKVFTKQDCATYLGRKNLLKKGYQPIQLTLTNNSDRSYTYSASSLSLPIVPAEKVALKVETSTWGRFFGYGLSAGALGTVSSVFFHAAYGAGIFCLGPVGMILGATAAVGSYTCFVASIADTVKSNNSNKKLSADFAEKAVSREGIIRPYQTVNGIVFVEKNDFKKDFTFTVNDLQTNKVVVLHSHAEYVTIK
jgi:hypothetical protein